MFRIVRGQNEIGVEEWIRYVTMKWLNNGNPCWTEELSVEVEDIRQIEQIGIGKKFLFFLSFFSNEYSLNLIFKKQNSLSIYAL